MTTQTAQKWHDVGDRLEALALKMKLHVKEELSADETSVGSALDRLRSASAEVFHAVRDAIGDDAVKEDVEEAGRAFADALDASFKDLHAAHR